MPENSLKLCFSFFNFPPQCKIVGLRIFEFFLISGRISSMTQNFRQEETGRQANHMLMSWRTDYSDATKTTFIINRFLGPDVVYPTTSQFEGSFMSSKYFFYSHFRDILMYFHENSFVAGIPALGGSLLLVDRCCWWIAVVGGISIVAGILAVAFLLLLLLLFMMFLLFMQLF